MVHLQQEVKNLVEKSSQVDDTRLVEPTFRASSNENIFVRIRTLLRVQFGPFWVQKGQFMVHLLQEVENLGLLNPFLEPVPMEVFSERSGPILMILARSVEPSS